MNGCCVDCVCNALHQTVSNDESQVEMVFWSIQQPDFGMYYLMAENDIGSSEVTVVLHAAYDTAHPRPAPPSRIEQLQELFAQSEDSKYNSWWCWLLQFSLQKIFLFSKNCDVNFVGICGMVVQHRNFNVCIVWSQMYFKYEFSRIITYSLMLKAGYFLMHIKSYWKF